MPARPAAVDPADPAARVAAALAAVVRRARLSGAFDRVARAAGIDLDRAGFDVLTLVGESGPMRISALAAGLDVTLPTASRHVSRLEEAGHLRRTADPADARACRVELTERGRDAVAHVTAARAETVQRLLADWPEEDRGELARLLDALVASLRA